MGDMHKFPRHSVELAQHESVVPEEQIKANKSLKKFAVVLAACAILFLGVMAVAAIAQTYKINGKPGGGTGKPPDGLVRTFDESLPDGCTGSTTHGTCYITDCSEYRKAECQSNHGR
jgi:hypothetical protein